MQSRIHRFDFGALRDFRGPLNTLALEALTQEEEVVPPPPPVYSAEDLEAARIAAKKQGYSEGFAAGQAEAIREVDHRITQTNAIIERLGKTLGDTRTRYEQQLATELRELSPLALAVAQKVAAEALDKRGAECIVAMIERCLPVILSKPKLVIELHPEAFEHTLNRIEETLRGQGVEAEIEFRGNAELASSDVGLHWGNGQMRRDTQALWEEIRTILDHTLQEHQPSQNSPPLHEEPQE